MYLIIIFYSRLSRIHASFRLDFTDPPSTSHRNYFDPNVDDKKKIDISLGYDLEFYVTTLKSINEYQSERHISLLEYFAFNRK